NRLLTLKNRGAYDIETYQRGKNRQWWYTAGDIKPLKIIQQELVYRFIRLTIQKYDFKSSRQREKTGFTLPYTLRSGECPYHTYHETNIPVHLDCLYAVACGGLFPAGKPFLQRCPSTRRTVRYQETDWI